VWPSRAGARSTSPNSPHGYASVAAKWRVLEWRALKRSVLHADPVHMRLRLRENAPWVAVGAGVSAVMAWLGLYGFAWNDYELEALPSVHALVHGQLSTFFATAPVYGGSLLERAPFALLPGLWGGGDLAVYRMLAAPCLLAVLLLGLWLAGRLRSSGAGRFAPAVVFGLCVANPLTLAALELGHPEELLGGVLCIAAVLLAVRDRSVLAGVLLGAAVANKQWALIALGPVLLALPGTRLLSRGRLLCTVSAGVVSVALLAPFALVAPTSFASGVHGAASPGSAIFQPWQLWWFFGRHGAIVHGVFGAIKPGYRTGPAWAAVISHPLIVALALPLTFAAWPRRGVHEAARGNSRNFEATHVPPGEHSIVHASPDERSISLERREANALLLLSLLLLLRCMLDTWDIVYYPIPFVLALGTWETLAARRAPLLALASAIAVWAEWKWLPAVASADAQAAFFVLWSVPLALGLAAILYRRPAGATDVRLADDSQILREARQDLVPVGG
jgi:hypothetical protein